MDNYPAVSSEWAMSECPEARDAERSKLLELANLRPGIRVLDLQAAGGYLADGIYQHLNGAVDIICLEPCKQLNRRLSDNYQLVEDPVERWSSVADCSVDLVVGLAGLHHSNDQQATVNEAFRVLKPGGQVVICDVVDDSDIAAWLNVFVDKHNPSGHKGCFLASGKLSQLYANAGFAEISESIESVPWRFNSKVQMAHFFKGLFGLHIDEESIFTALNKYLSLCNDDNGVSVDWKLIYGSGIK